MDGQTATPYPSQSILDEFAFLVKQRQYVLEDIFRGRGVSVSFRRDSFAITIEYEWGVNWPILIVEKFSERTPSLSTRCGHFNDETMQRLGWEPGTKSYPVHAKLQRLIFPFSTFYAARHRDELDAEVKARIKEYADFIKQHEAEALRYVEEEVRPEYLEDL